MNNEAFKVNYHSHTKRCGHATGEDEEYVKSAIECGYQIYGFSDHVILPGLEQAGMRGSYEKDFQDYLDSIHSLQKKYKNKLEIHLAFEAEWLEERYASYYYHLLKDKVVDYLIIGQHGFLDEKTNKFIFYASLKDKKEATRMYVHDLIEGMRSHDFIYVAHPDLFMIWYGVWDDFAIDAARKIINVAKEEKIIFELNMGPSRWARKGDDENFKVPYPFEEFWYLVREADIPCIIGIDNHSPEELKTTPYDWMRRFVKRHDLHPLECLELPFKK